MIAAHGKVQTLRVGIPAAFDFTDAPPVDVRRIAVLFVASDDAALTTDALRHVEVKTILFTKFEGALRNAGGLGG